MRTIAVVIPYFQREPGILGKALNSIHSQLIPEGWSVEVIVVDDGSPCSADEVRHITFTEARKAQGVLARKRWCRGGSQSCARRS